MLLSTTVTGIIFQFKVNMFENGPKRGDTHKQVSKIVPRIAAAASGRKVYSYSTQLYSDRSACCALSADPLFYTHSWRVFRYGHNVGLDFSCFLISMINFGSLMIKAFVISTGKSLSEALILASTNPEYDDRLFIELWVQYMKIASSEHVRNLLCMYTNWFWACNFHVLNS